MGIIRYYVGDIPKERKVFQLNVRVFNDSSHKAINPYVRIVLPAEKIGKKFVIGGRFSKVIKTHLTKTGLWQEKEDDFELAYWFTAQCLTFVGSIPQAEDGQFTLGFAFENGTDFYLPYQQLSKYSIGSSLNVAMVVGAEHFERALVPFATLKIEAWDRVTVTDENGNSL